MQPFGKSSLQSVFLRRRQVLLLGLIFLLLAAAIGMVNFKAFRSVSSAKQGISYAVAYTGRVTRRHIQTDADGVTGLLAGTEEVRVHILSGPYLGNTVGASAILTTEMQVVPRAGQFVTVSIDRSAAGSAAVLIDGVFRLPVWIFAAALLAVCLWWIGRRKGFFAFLALVFNLACVLGLFIPLVFQGHSPLLCAFAVLCVMAAVTFWMMDGLSAKSLIAFTGTIGGAVLACLAAMAVGKAAQLNGFAMSDADSLTVIAQSTRLKVEYLLLAGVLVASFGAVMDVAMSIAAAVEELYGHNPAMPAGELFQAGMRVGGDMMGTMVNTLLLAYAGASIATLLMLYSYLAPVGQSLNGHVLEYSAAGSQVPLWVLLNDNLVGTELMEGLTGAVAIILTVPLVSGIGAKLLPFWKYRRGLQ